MHDVDTKVRQLQQSESSSSFLSIKSVFWSLLIFIHGEKSLQRVIFTTYHLHSHSCKLEKWTVFLQRTQDRNVFCPLSTSFYITLTSSRWISEVEVKHLDSSAFISLTDSCWTRFRRSWPPSLWENSDIRPAVSSPTPTERQEEADTDERSTDETTFRETMFRDTHRHILDYVFVCLSTKNTSILLWKKVREVFFFFLLNVSIKFNLKMVQRGWHLSSTTQFIGYHGS